MIYVALCIENIIRGTHIGLILINFTLILPLDAFKYNIDNPDDWKLLTLHGGKLKLPQLMHMEASWRCFGMLGCVPTWKCLAQRASCCQAQLQTISPSAYRSLKDHQKSMQDCLTAHLSNTHSYTCKHTDAAVHPQHRSVCSAQWGRLLHDLLSAEGDCSVPGVLIYNVADGNNENV